VPDCPKCGAAGDKHVERCGPRVRVQCVWVCVVRDPLDDELDEALDDPAGETVADVLYVVIRVLPWLVVVCVSAGALAWLGVIPG
jgi:hypothetical protein